MKSSSEFTVWPQTPSIPSCVKLWSTYDMMVDAR